MKIYQTKVKKLSGTNFSEVMRQADLIFRTIKARTKRRPYIRSVYFNKSKIFLGLFFQHTHEKNWRDAVRRMKFFSCAIELIKNSKYEPLSKQDPNNSDIILHRFAGATSQKELFYVQIKENKRSGEKSLLSVFPEQ